MKIKKYSQFLIKESFGLSPQLLKFIDRQGVNWNEFTESLIEISDIPGAQISKYRHIIDQSGHIINVDLENDKQYKIQYKIVIDFNCPRSGNIQLFSKNIQNLNTISINIEEMIDRITNRGIEMVSNNFTTSESSYRTGTIEVNYKFEVKFESDIDMQELKKCYDEYLGITKFTPEFNEGLKKLVKAYQEENINLMQFLDIAHGDAGDVIILGFVTEDDIYGIADYDIKSKKFTIDGGEIEDSIMWYRENYGFD